MKLIRNFNATSCLALALFALTGTQSGCGSSSSEESVAVKEGMWTLTSAQFASGMYKISMKSTHGPDIDLIPSAGGLSGVMQVAGKSTPVTFVYAPDAEPADYPANADLTVTFTEPGAASMVDVLFALGVTLVRDEDGAAVMLPEGASIDFRLEYTPYTSVRTIVEATPSTEFEQVRGTWVSFDGIPSVNQTLASWVLIDMLQTTFDVEPIAAD